MKPDPVKVAARATTARMRANRRKRNTQEMRVKHELAAARRQASDLEAACRRAFPDFIEGGVELMMARAVDKVTDALAQDFVQRNANDLKMVFDTQIRREIVDDARGVYSPLIRRAFDNAAYRGYGARVETAMRPETAMTAMTVRATWSEFFYEFNVVSECLR